MSNIFRIFAKYKIDRMLNKEENKQEIIALYNQYKSSDIIAEKLQSKYDLFDTSIGSLSRKIRKWLSDYRQSEIGVKKSNEKSPAKILLFDLETSPMISYHFGKWGVNINDDDIIQDWKILCFSAKWLFEDKMLSFKMTKKELKTFDDSRLAKELWKLLDEADIVIAHNANKFDIKRSNTKFLENRLNLPSSYQVIDTLLHARKKFAITSNRIDYIGQYLNVGRKIETPKGMWREVMKGNYKMLKTMSEYCDGDIRLLEDVYLEMRPYIVPHPNVSLYITENVKACTCCGSKNLENTGKSYSTTVNTFDLYRCVDCGSLMRDRVSNMTLGQRKKILSSVPQ